jgi:hypothetical protein
MSIRLVVGVVKKTVKAFHGFGRSDFLSPFLFSLKTIHNFRGHLIMEKKMKKILTALTLF